MKYTKQKANLSFNRYLNQSKKSQDNSYKGDFSNSRNKYYAMLSNNRKSEIKKIDDIGSDPFDILKKHKELFSKHNWNIANLLK